jgi:hypothetical protein
MSETATDYGRRGLEPTIKEVFPGLRVGDAWANSCNIFVPLFAERWLCAVQNLRRCACALLARGSPCLAVLPCSARRLLRGPREPVPPTSC